MLGRQIREFFLKVCPIFNNKNLFLNFLKKSGIFLLFFIVLYGIGSFIPEGFDWQNYFKIGRLHPIWTPWTKYIVQWVTPPGFGFVFALTILSIAVRTYRYRPSPYPLVLALFSLPTMWVIFMGNLDGLVLLGLMIMPVGILLVLMKPQVAAFALLARRNWLITGIIWVLLSIIIWGFWPKNLLMVTTPEWSAEWIQDISIFPWGIIIGAPLLWYSRGDQDLLMAAGSLMTPHLFPYHFIILMPSLARMRWTWMLLTWLVSWMPLLANWLGPQAWHFGNLLSLGFWFGIYLNKKSPRPGPIKHLSDLFNENQVCQNPNA